jgi:MtrB/PioB family decaheme-associated outer membrane protein
VENAPGVYTLPDSLQSLGQRSAGTAYTRVLEDAMSNAGLVDNSVQTDVSTVRLRGRPLAGWRFEVRGEQRERSGHKPYGATFGFSNAVELMEPIHQRTLDGSATASYEKSRLKAQASFGVSAFKNFIGEMDWDNPARLTPVAGTPSVGRLDLYPNNQVVRGNVAVGYTLPRKTLVSGTFGISQGTQNDDWLPMTSNTALAQSSLSALPGKSTDAKMVRTNVNLRLLTRAVSKLSATVRFDRTEADNQTPAHIFSGVVPYDGSFTAGPDTTHSFGNTQMLLGGDLDYQLLDRLGLGLTYEWRQRDHTEREVEKDKENVFGARADAEITDDLHAMASFRYGDRKLDQFNVDDYLSGGVLAEQAGLRRYDVANRKQTYGDVNLTWSVTSWFDAGVEYSYRLDNYPDSQFGLTRNEDQLVMSEGTLRPDQRTELEGGYGFGRTETRQNSHQSNGATIDTDPINDWTGKLNDTNVYFYLDGKWWAVPKKVSLDAGYEVERVLGEYHLISTGSLDLPSTFYRRQEARLGAKWQVAPRTTLEGRWEFQELDFVDVLKQDIPLLQIAANGTVNSIWLGNSTLNYRAHRVEVLVSRRF